MASANDEERESNWQGFDVKQMRIRHGSLIKAVVKQILKNNVSLDRVKLLVVPRLKIDLSSPEFQQNGAELDNIYDFFYHLRTKGYMPFFSLSLMETIVTKFAEECRPLLEEYKKNHLWPFLDMRLPTVEEECFNHEEISGQKKLSIKVDRDWDTTKLSEVLEFTKEVADILGIPEEQLVFEAVKEGCINVVCRFFQQSSVSPLTTSQQQKMKKLSVKQLKCDGQTLLANVQEPDETPTSESVFKQKIMSMYKCFEEIYRNMKKLLKAIEPGNGNDIIPSCNIGVLAKQNGDGKEGTAGNANIAADGGTYGKLGVRAIAAVTTGVVAPVGTILVGPIGTVVGAAIIGTVIGMGATIGFGGIGAGGAHGTITNEIKFWGVKEVQGGTAGLVWYYCCNWIIYQWFHCRTKQGLVT